VLIKYGHVHKPTIVKAYICVFVSLAVKAIHLELVSDLTADAFTACLQRFIYRCGLPCLMWRDHGTNFVGAAREIKNLYQFLRDSSTKDAITKFLTTKNTNWKFCENSHSCSVFSSVPFRLSSASTVHRINPSLNFPSNPLLRVSALYTHDPRGIAEYSK